MSAPPDQKAREDAVLEKANTIKTLWKHLSTGLSLPPEEPRRSATHWDYLLQESAWMAHDFMQERLWRQAMSYQLAQEAAKFDRKKLKPASGDVVAALKKEIKETASAQPTAPASPSGQGEPPLPMGPLVFQTPEDLMAAVIAQLEEEDVMRLSRAADDMAAYSAAYEAAAHSRPPGRGHDDDEMGPRKMGLKSKLRIKMGGGAGAGGLDDTDSQGEPSPALMGGRAGGQRRISGPAGMGMGMRPGMQDMDDGPGGKRKRKAREFDDDEYMGAAAKAAAAARKGLGPIGMHGPLTDAKGKKFKSPLKGPGMHPGMDPAAAAKAGFKGGFGVRPPGSEGVRGIRWDQTDDQVLAAIVTEFGQNWQLVADVMRATTSMQGMYRRADFLKYQYARMLKQMQEEAGGGEDLQTMQALQQLAVQLMPKQQAKEVLLHVLPVPEPVLRRHQEVLTSLAGRAKQKRMADKAAQRDAYSKYRPEQHPSHYKLQQQALAISGGRVLSPLDLNPIDAGQQAPPGAGGAMGQGAGAPMDPAAAAAAAQAQQAAAMAGQAAMGQQQQQQQQQQPMSTMGSGMGGLSGQHSLPPSMSGQQQAGNPGGGRGMPPGMGMGGMPGMGPGGPSMGMQPGQPGPNGMPGGMQQQGGPNPMHRVPSPALPGGGGAPVGGPGVPPGMMQQQGARPTGPGGPGGNMGTQQSAQLQKMLQQQQQQKMMQPGGQQMTPQQQQQMAMQQQQQQQGQQMQGKPGGAPNGAGQPNMPGQQQMQRPQMPMNMQGQQQQQQQQQQAMGSRMPMMGNMPQMQGAPMQGKPGQMPAMPGGWQQQQQQGQQRTGPGGMPGQPQPGMPGMPGAGMQQHPQQQQAAPGGWPGPGFPQAPNPQQMAQMQQAYAQGFPGMPPMAGMPPQYGGQQPPPGNQ